MHGAGINKIFSKLKSTGFFHIFGSSTINKIVTFASSIVLVRIVSKAEYGVYSYAYNLLSFFILLSGFGLSSGILQICSATTDEIKKKDIYTYACQKSLIINFSLSVIILLTSLFVPFQMQGVNYCLAIMAFEPCVMILYEMPIMMLRIDLRNKEFSYANSLSTIAVFILSCILAWFFSVNGLVAARYIASIITFLVIFWRFKVSFSLSKRAPLDHGTKKILWHVSIISMFNNGLSRLMYLLDIFVLGLINVSEMIIASYKVATIIPTGLSFIPGAVATYIFPYFVRNKDNKKWVLKRYSQLMLAMSVGGLIISLPLIIFAPTFIKLIFGETYLDAVPAFRILMISFIFSSALRVLAGNVLVTQMRLKFNLFIAIFSSALNTTLNVFFIQAFNAVGAAYATLLTVCLTGVINVCYLFYVLLHKDKEKNIEKEG